MKVVDDNRSIRAIEEKIAKGLVEELIVAAHNELKLIRLMKNWKPWEQIFAEAEDKQSEADNLNFTGTNPFATSFETFENLRTNRPIRKATAAIHPEDFK